MQETYNCTGRPLGDRWGDRWATVGCPLGARCVPDCFEETKQQASSISVTSLTGQAESHGPDMGMTSHFTKHADNRFAKLVGHHLTGWPSAAG